MSLKNSVAFKGTSNGLFIEIDEDLTFEEVIDVIKGLHKQSGQFYKGGTVIGLVGKALTYREKGVLEEILVEQFALNIESLEAPVAKRSPKPKPEKKLEKEVPVEKKPAPPKVEKAPEPEPVSEPIVKTHYVFGTMRSGQSVEHRGDVVVIGDVNPGAQIIAEGNIFVMGRVLGFVHAGSGGDDTAFVVANLLKPTQIRISKFISVPPNEDVTTQNATPERAYVSEGIIKIEKTH